MLYNRNFSREVWKFHFSLKRKRSYLFWDRSLVTFGIKIGATTRAIYSRQSIKCNNSTLAIIIRAISKCTHWRWFGRIKRLRYQPHGRRYRLSTELGWRVCPAASSIALNADLSATLQLHKRTKNLDLDSTLRRSSSKACSIFIREKVPLEEIFALIFAYFQTKNIRKAAPRSVISLIIINQF